MNDETKNFLVELFDLQERRLDAKIDAKFAEQNAKIDAKFAEQSKLFEAKFDELRFEVNEIVGEILDVVTNKFKRERKKTDEKIKNKIAIL